MEWISTKDSLPQEGVFVIASIDKSPPVTAIVITGQWMTYTLTQKGKTINYKSVHKDPDLWMPIPPVQD